MIGVDPAPGKGLCIFDPEHLTPEHAPGNRYGADEEYRLVGPKDARTWFESIIDIPHLLLAWDAPLMVNFAETLTERPIERYLRRSQSDLGPGTSVMGFGGCPHWSISQYTLGLPLPVGITDQRRGLPLIGPDTGHRRGIIEVHPAIAIAVLLGATPVYKRPASRSRCIVDALKGACIREGLLNKFVWRDLPPKGRAGFHLDDFLDAQVAGACGQALASGESLFLGDSTGYFVVPSTACAVNLQEGFLRKL